MDDKKLLKLFVNAAKRLDSDERASIVLAEIQKEWNKRKEQAEKGLYKADMPDIGMLKTFGYAVGNSGVDKKDRIELLTLIFVSDLPLVGSPAYTAEWGNKCSQERLTKLDRTLRTLIFKAKKDGTWDKAIDEWKDDLGYVRNELKKMVC